MLLEIIIFYILHTNTQSVNAKQNQLNDLKPRRVRRRVRNTWWAVWINDCLSGRIWCCGRCSLPLQGIEALRKQIRGAANTPAKYLSMRKAKWWLSISLLPCEPVNRRAAITHVLTACNGIFLGWAKGCQACLLQITKEETRWTEKSGDEDQRNQSAHTCTHTHTRYLLIKDALCCCL